jgi:hypothetical protein
MPRPKKTAGTAGKAQRHDTVMPTQPVQAPTGMAYGAHAESVAAQNALPLPQAPPPGAAPTGGPATGGGPPPGSPFGAAVDAASAMQPPDPTQILSAPTARPGEPLTHGMPFGPGGGPEVLQPPDPRQTTAAILNALGTEIDPQTKRLRDVLNAQLGNQGAQ